jgi:Rrf2 family nitric oxide-sensitive transcriptional repressor
MCLTAYPNCPLHTLQLTAGRSLDLVRVDDVVAIPGGEKPNIVKAVHALGRVSYLTTQCGREAAFGSRWRRTASA